MGDQAITFKDEPPHTSAQDTSSIEVLFRKHHERVFLAAYRVSGNVPDAEDALQSVFLRLLKKSEQQQFDINPANYLCRAAINASLDLLRSRQRVRLVDLEDSSHEPEMAVSTAEGEAKAFEQRKQLRAALLQLNPRAAEIFALRYFEDFSNSDIAEILNTSSSSIAVTLHRTREQLQNLLREFAGGNQ